MTARPTLYRLLFKVMWFRVTKLVCEAYKYFCAFLVGRSEDRDRTAGRELYFHIVVCVCPLRSINLPTLAFKNNLTAAENIFGLTVFKGLQNNNKSSIFI